MPIPSQRVGPVPVVQPPLLQICPMSHLFPHVPQFAESTIRLVVMLPHIVVRQMPSLHSTPVGQAKPHCPQLAESLYVFLEIPSQ